MQQHRTTCTYSGSEERRENQWEVHQPSRLQFQTSRLKTYLSLLECNSWFPSYPCICRAIAGKSPWSLADLTEPFYFLAQFQPLGIARPGK